MTKSKKDQLNWDHPHRKWKKEDCELLEQLWNEGAATEFIAQAFGVSKRAVFGMRHRMGLPLRQRPRRGKEYEASSAARYNRWRY